jgi:hypothetical protein
MISKIVNVKMLVSAAVVKSSAIMINVFLLNTYKST